MYLLKMGTQILQMHITRDLKNPLCLLSTPMMGKTLSKNKGCGTSSVTNHGEFRTSAFDFHTARTTMVAQVLFLRDLTKIHPHHIPQKKFKVGKIVVRPCDRSTQLLLKTVNRVFHDGLRFNEIDSQSPFL